MKESINEPIMEVKDKDGNPASLEILEEHGVAFDPTRQTMDLNKEEKRRTTALMMAIQAYSNLIIKDAEMYVAISRENDRKEAPKIQPATMHAMVDAAIQFDRFIRGDYDQKEAEDQPE